MSLILLNRSAELILHRLGTHLSDIRVLTSSNPTIRENKEVCLRLSGDGTKIGKRLHVVVFTFTILDEDQAGPARGNHILAVFKQPESYDCLKLALDDIIKELDTLREIAVKDIT